MASVGARLEGAAFAGLVALFRWLHPDDASALGARLGRWLGPLLGRRRHRQAGRNLARFVGGDVARIRADMWAQVGRVAGEMPHLAALAQDRVELVGREHLDAALAGGGSVLLVAGHLANWELLPFVAAGIGLPLTAVAREAGNPASERLLRRLRAGGAASLIPKGRDGARALLKAARDGRHLCFLVDQRFSEGIAVPFFGVPAMTTPAAATLALRHGGTVLPVRLERLGGAHFRVTIEPPVPLDGDVATITAAINARLEAWIRARPDQWLWTHRRWPEV